MASSSSRSAGEVTKNHSLEELLEHLDLKDEEFDDVVLQEKDLQELKASTQMAGGGQGNYKEGRFQ
jgi:hypothetical protein